MQVQQECISNVSRIPESMRSLDGVDWIYVASFLSRLTEKNGVIIDDHTGTQRTIDHIAVFGPRGDSSQNKIVYLPLSGFWPEVGYCSVNEMYISERDGYVHLSRRSIGGVIQSRHGDLHEACNEYNRGLDESQSKLAATQARFLHIIDLNA